MFKELTLIKKPAMKVRHLPIGDDLKDKTWDMFFSACPKVTYERYVAENNGEDELMYRVTLICTDEAWDELNRKIGAAGLTVDSDTK